MPNNRLVDEKSPYLLQHADNPVDWYAWGDEAFTKAKNEDKPVFLSIGYATCHWCHVMAHESFEDPQIAELMNHAFINIKVDREERPDIDHTYMTVCQMMTGSGGWPLTIFMTPEKKPFYAATYIPKKGRYGRPGMMELVPWIQKIWDENREKVYSSADEISDLFQQSNKLTPGQKLTGETIHHAFRQFDENFDEEHGGFGASPKFPSPHNLMFLLRYWKRSDDDQALKMVDKTLTRMRMGGIYDHIGFGFHRYSTDAGWLVPHFEKMLYDQAMLMLVYTEAWQATANPLFEQTVDEIALYIFRDMRDEGGAFYSAEDADSEGEEGKFYVWDVEEITKALPKADAEFFIGVFNLEKGGNFKEESTNQKMGTNIPHLKKSIEELADERSMKPDELKKKIKNIRTKLFEIREKRIRPLLDDKILTDWNGLMIAASARAGTILQKQKYIEKAEKACRFIISEMQNDDGTLLHRYRKEDAAIAGHADDYAFFIWGLLELYEATFKTEYLEMAIELNHILIEKFWDEDNGGFFFTARTSEELLGRKKEGYDGAIPSGNSVAMMNLLKLAKITTEPRFEEKAEQIGLLFSEQIQRAPTGFGQMLQAVNFALGPSYEIVVAGRKETDDTHEMLRRLHRYFIPDKVIVLNDPEDNQIQELVPFIKNQTMENGRATVYICQNYTCEQPITEPDELADKLL